MHEFDETAGRWREGEVAARYARGRFSPRARQRDPRLVLRLLRRHAPRAARPLALDAPCGAGRLREALRSRGARCVGLDVSAAMLAEARAAGYGRLVRADVAGLPVRDGAFDLVLCCRLLHHLPDDGALAGAIADLVRASRDLVIASFWDAGTFAARRRRGRERDARRAIPRERIAELFAAAGAPVVGYASSVPLVTAQTFLAARVAAGAT